MVVTRSSGPTSSKLLTRSTRRTSNLKKPGVPFTPIKSVTEVNNFLYTLDKGTTLWRQAEEVMDHYVSIQGQFVLSDLTTPTIVIFLMTFIWKGMVKLLSKDEEKIRIDEVEVVNTPTTQHGRNKEQSSNGRRNRRGKGRKNSNEGGKRKRRGRGDQKPTTKTQKTDDSQTAQSAQSRSHAEMGKEEEQGSQVRRRGGEKRKKVFRSE
mmetsp:Transcript_5360/g.8808  ORF Transcript_5360/g.8808 Transcript_5360/m.8808 type:complete len:208 (-) Transcript_5360:1142-1765(-)